jgi:hypothetical protein
MYLWGRIRVQQMKMLYREALADEVYSHIVKYYSVMQKTYQNLQKKFATLK